MKFLTIAILIAASYFAPNAVAQDSNEAPTANSQAQAESSDYESTEIDKPADVPGERLAEPLVRYVSDEFYVPLRETPCRLCKIVHRGIKTGTELNACVFNHESLPSLFTRASTEQTQYGGFVMTAASRFSHAIVGSSFST